MTLVISAINNSANETMTIRNIFFGAGAGDTDLDGMTDGYEDANGLDRLSPADRDLDLDGDGQTNYQEFLAGSAANNGRSFLQITSVVFDAAAAEAVIRWASAAGRRYQLQFTPDLSTPWVDAGNPVTASGEETQVVQPVAGLGPAGAGFVRVKVLP